MIQTISAHDIALINYKGKTKLVIVRIYIEMILNIIPGPFLIHDLLPGL